MGSPVPCCCLRQPWERSSKLNPAQTDPLPKPDMPCVLTLLSAVVRVDICDFPPTQQCAVCVVPGMLFRASVSSAKVTLPSIASQALPGRRLKLIPAIRDRASSTSPALSIGLNLAHHKWPRPATIFQCCCPFPSSGLGSACPAYPTLKCGSAQQTPMYQQKSFGFPPWPAPTLTQS